VCRQFVPNSRCSHCAYTTKARDLTVIINACTSPPEEDPASFCDKSQLWMCSCGQRFPAAVQLGPAPTQSRKPQQQKQQQQLITAANPPDLTQAETVDLSTWPKQAVLGGGVGGGGVTLMPFLCGGKVEGVGDGYG
ncbi:hypothetical protein MMC31_006551, partial [Peltigera leucophlebia]|nr:hypothetical protein [Peltigera leucophlebia]